MRTEDTFTTDDGNNPSSPQGASVICPPIGRINKSSRRLIEFLPFFCETLSGRADVLLAFLSATTSWAQLCSGGGTLHPQEDAIAAQNQSCNYQIAFTYSTGRETTADWVMNENIHILPHTQRTPSTLSDVIINFRRILQMK